MISDGLSAHLSSENIDVVATATDARDVLNLAYLAKPDVAVLDVSLSPIASSAIACELATRTPIRIVLLSAGWGAVTELDCARPHAHGFVPLTEPARFLAETIHAVADGENRVPDERPRTASVLSTAGELERLGNKQLRVLELIAHGHTSQEIGERLGIHVRTADNHRATIMRKLGVRNVVQLVRLAIRAGLVNP